VRSHEAASKHSAISVRDPLANLLTLHGTSIRKPRQCLTGLEDRLLGAADGRAERGCDLLV
jgi:hypothetical protein